MPDAKEDEAGSVENPIEVGEAADDNTDNATKSILLQQDKRLSKLSRIKPKRVQSRKQQLSDRRRRIHVKGCKSEVRPSQKLMPKGTKNKPTHRKGSDSKVSRNKPNRMESNINQLSETRPRKDVQPPLDLMPKGTKKNMPIRRARTPNDGRQRS